MVKAIVDNIKGLYSLLVGLVITGRYGLGPFAILFRLTKKEEGLPLLTTHYPWQSIAKEDLVTYRGPVELIPAEDDPAKSKCVSCMMCVKSCPSSCLTVVKADEGKAESGPMASEAGQLSAENAANTPDDPEAAAEAREQGGKMNQAGADIGTTDEAVTRTREKAGSLGDDAARAEQTNTETGARLDGNDEQLSASGEKLGEMAAQNAAARASVEALAAAPDAQRQQAGQLEGQGAGLVTASFDIEGRLAAVQRDYAQAMQAGPAEDLP